jgi:branched-chain amino acid aminotransferase group I
MIGPKIPESKNENIQIYIDGQLFPREEAKISVFDSTVQGGDAVWEGLRVYNGRIFMLDAHLDRMIDSARAMVFHGIPTRDSLKHAIFQTLIANHMNDDVHIRLTLSRGKKVTSGMNPEFNQYGCTLIVLPEWKKPVYDINGIKLITSSIRRNPPQCIDSKIHHNNLINNILAKIEANYSGADDAVMIDIEGFISETNATNVFFIKKGNLFTPNADSCLPGITRGVVIDIAKNCNIPVYKKRISLAEMYSCDEMFVTGTMGEITPVLEVDGRIIGSGEVGIITKKIRLLFSEKTRNEGEVIPF